MKAIHLAVVVTLAWGVLSAGATESGQPTTEPVDRTRPPASGSLPSVHFPEPAAETLPNGLRFYILASRREPIVTYRLMIKSGSMFDGGKPGLAELTADLLNKGTAELTADQFAKKTDFIGASVEASDGSDAVTVVASGLANYADELLGFLRDAALHPAFLEEEVKRQQIQNISNLTQKKMDPEDLAARLRNKLLYGEHPYGKSATPESVRSITREDVVKFHDTFFVPNNATLVVVGDVNPEAIRTAVRKAFGDWKQGTVPALNPPAFPKVEGVSIHLVDRPASVQSNILFAGRGISHGNPDAPELQVVNSVLGGGCSGRLFANLREKHAFTYGSYSGFQEKKFGGTFTATAEVRNAVTADAATEMLNELKRIVSEPIPDPELNLQRNYLAGNFLLSLESNQRTAERIQDVDLYGLPEDYYKTYARRLTTVTPEKAFELAKKYIDPNDGVIVVVGEAKDVLPQLQKLGKVTVYDTDLKAKK